MNDVCILSLRRNFILTCLLHGTCSYASPTGRRGVKQGEQPSGRKLVTACVLAGEFKSMTKDNVPADVQKQEKCRADIRAKIQMLFVRSACHKQGDLRFAFAGFRPRHHPPARDERQVENVCLGHSLSKQLERSCVQEFGTHTTSEAISYLDKRQVMRKTCAHFLSSWTFVTFWARTIFCGKYRVWTLLGHS